VVELSVHAAQPISEQVNDVRQPPVEVRSLKLGRHWHLFVVTFRNAPSPQLVQMVEDEHSRQSIQGWQELG
jgi:hypothetical protein